MGTMNTYTLIESPTHESVGSRVEEFEIVGVNLDLFCIPMPDVADLRARVLKRMGAK